MDKSQIVRQAQLGNLTAVQQLVRHLDAAEKTITELFFGAQITADKLRFAAEHLVSLAAASSLTVTISGDAVTVAART